MTLNEWTKAIHDNATEHGWWDEERSFGDIIALCHSELSEALEAYRRDEDMVWVDSGKPEGMAVEMMDCLIRILDWFGNEGIDAEQVLTMKHEFNLTRPYRHGSKKL